MEMQTVKLSSLVRAENIDSRKGKADVSDLIHSIKACGLIQPLLVRKAGEQYEVIAGNRRFAALLAIGENPDVPVIVRDDVEDVDALELSTMENVLRKPIHPVDEYESYASLIDQGRTPEQIAKLFAVKVAWVRQRLQLRCLAPSLRDLWRKGGLTAEQAEALTAADDHKTQEAVWAEACKGHGEYWKGPAQLRQKLSQFHYTADEPTIEFIGGVKAYEAAGGRTRKDLFVEEQQLIDVDVVQKLLDAKMEARRQELLAEGWSFVIIEKEGHRWRPQIDLTPWMTPAQRKAYAKGATSPKGWEAKREAEALSKDDPAARAKSGVSISFSQGDIDHEWLLEHENKEEDASKSSFVDPDAEADESDEDDADEGQADPKGTVNHALVQMASEWMTLALSEVIATEPHVANAALAASLKVAMSGFASDLPFRVSTSAAWDALTGRAEVVDQAKAWIEAFQEYRKFPQVLMHAEIGKLAAKLFDVRVIRFNSTRGSGFDRGRPALLEALAKELPVEKLDRSVAERFDREGYFRKLTIAQITETLGELGLMSNVPKGKEPLVKLAAARAKDIGWLPPELRLPGLQALNVTKGA
jgi:ParB/RepB/Spo0J family partition protein